VCVLSEFIGQLCYASRIVGKYSTSCVVSRANSNSAPVVLEVSRDDTVASVKAKLHDMEGVHPHRQRLVFACSALPDDDETTLADHGVVDSATIQLVEMRMNVFVHMGKTLLFSADSSDTVESFRLRLQPAGAGGHATRATAAYMRLLDAEGRPHPRRLWRQEQFDPAFLRPVPPYENKGARAGHGGFRHGGLN
jgi:hypothetical protein